MWVSLWGKGISELKEFPFIFKFRVGIKTQLMKTSKAHSHGKHYCPTIISETRYADILTRNRGWKERVPLILRGLVIRTNFTVAAIVVRRARLSISLNSEWKRDKWISTFPPNKRNNSNKSQISYHRSEARYSLVSSNSGCMQISGVITL
jgi:hypothetical protein